MHLVGKVLWWSSRDGKGVIEDPHGNEYYFDSSVINASKGIRVRAGTIVKFEINKNIKGTLCACNIATLNARETAAAKRAYQRQIDEAVL